MSRSGFRVVVAGAPPVAAPVVRGLVTAGYTIPSVYTQPDRPVGRGRRTRPSAVKVAALELGLSTRTPRTLRDPAEVSAISELAADVLVVAAYGLLLPQAVLDTPRLGCINVHASLLPRWRGAAPIERALIAGDSQTGISIMQMDAGLDTGPVLLRASLPLEPYSIGDEVTDTLASLGASTLIDALDRLPMLNPEPQTDRGVTYAPKLTPRDSRLDFAERADALARRICALNSRQPAAAMLGGERIRMLRARPAPEQLESTDCGTIVTTSRAGIDVACGDGTVLRVTELQLPGKKPAPAEALLRGYGALFARGARWQPLPDGAGR
jgi:methionyl-tRNA formyltransferase